MNCETKSVKKVFEYLQKNKQATPSELTTELSLNYNTVKACIEALQNMDKINSISNGRVTMIQLKVV
jgi:predicted transcriptional regulator